MSRKLWQHSAATSQDPDPVKLAAIFALILAAIFAAPNSFAQLPKTDMIAVQMANAVTHSKQKSVIVFDFWGPDEKVNAFGEYLAQGFSEALTKPALSFDVIDRSRIGAAYSGHALSSAGVSDSLTAWWIARDMGAQVVITGQLSNRDNKLEIIITSYKTQDGKRIAGFKTTLLITQDMQALLDKGVGDVAPSSDALHPAGKDGYTYPKCKHCPPAEYDNEAAEKKFQGTVTLVAIVGADGKAHGITVIKGLPYGLTRKAIEAVSRWDFYPALDPDKQPAPVRQTIEVTFHLY
jgi:TonB family protein